AASGGEGDGVVADTVRVGVIGAGGWGMNHVRALAAVPGAELVAVADAQELRRAAASAGRAGIRTYAAADDLLGDTHVDAVVIATDSPSHARVALAALDAGKHVLVEKPLALTTDDAQAIVARAEKTGRTLMVGHLLLHHPAVRRLADIAS